MRPRWKISKNSIKENRYTYSSKEKQRTQHSYLSISKDSVVPYPGISLHFHSKMLEWMSYFKLRAVYESLYGALKKKAKRVRKASSTSWKPKFESFNVRLERFHVNVRDFSTFLWDGTDHMWQGYE